MVAVDGYFQTVKNRVLAAKEIELKFIFLQKTFTVVVNIFAWFLVLMIPALEITTCTMGSEDAWLGTAILISPALVLSSWFITLTKKVRWSKWLSVPQVIITPWAIYIIFKYLWGVTLRSNHFCTVLKEPVFNSYSPSWWAPYWAPFMLVSIGILISGYYRIWQYKGN